MSEIAAQHPTRDQSTNSCLANSGLWSALSRSSVAYSAKLHLHLPLSTTEWFVFRGSQPGGVQRWPETSPHGNVSQTSGHTVKGEMLTLCCVCSYCSPGIPAALALLEGIAEVIGPNVRDLNEVRTYVTL